MSLLLKDIVWCCNLNYCNYSTDITMTTTEPLVRFCMPLLLPSSFPFSIIDPQENEGDVRSSVIKLSEGHLKHSENIPHDRLACIFRKSICSTCAPPPCSRPRRNPPKIQKSPRLLSQHHTHHDRNCITASKPAAKTTGPRLNFNILR